MRDLNTSIQDYFGEYGEKELHQFHVWLGLDGYYCAEPTVREPNASLRDVIWNGEEYEDMTGA